MARLPVATRESVPEAQRAIFDEMVKGLGSVPRYGPGSVMVHVPKAHQWATGLNHYLREESSLPKKIQELAMLVTARELDCQHIWNAHAASARKAGVRDEIVDALRDRKEFLVWRRTKRRWCTTAANSSVPTASAGGRFRSRWSSLVARESSS